MLGISITEGALLALTVLALVAVVVAATRHAITTRMALLLGIVSVVVPVVGPIVGIVWSLRAMLSKDHGLARTAHA